MSTPNYSKSEWASLSIQERIRAMNKVAGDDDSLSIAAEEQSVAQEERPSLPKRSSVVDIWRKRDSGGGGSATKPKPASVIRSPSPVSVPWPDEEETNGGVGATNLQATSFQQQKTTVPSWKRQLKSTSASKPSTIEKKEADLTILPSTSMEDEEVAAAASTAVSSHSKSVMDLFTKRTLTIPDSPMTIATEGDDSISVATPKRSSVVDIWTKRSSADTPKTTPARKTNSLGSATKQIAVAAATPPSKIQSAEKKKESPLKAWNRRKSAPARPAMEEETDLVVVQDEEEEEETIPKETSVLNRYKQLAELRSAPPPRPPTVVETGPSYESSESLDKPKPSSVVSAWGSQLRKVQRNVPSPVTTEPTVDDDEYTDESAVEEPKSSSVVNRWKPQAAASGESPQLQKTPTRNVPSPVVMPQSGGSNSSIASRWNPQRSSGASPYVQKSNATTVSDSKPAVEDADGEKEPAPVEEPKPSSVANRWKPHGSFASPQLRKVPPKLPLASKTESSALDADNEQETPMDEPPKSSVANRWNPQGNLKSPQLRKVPPKVPAAIETKSSAMDADHEKETTASETPIRKSIANRWNPQGHSKSPQLQKVSPGKLPSAINIESSAVNADDEEGQVPVVATPSRSGVANRWNPQGSLASPQLRKVIDKVATPVGAQRPAVATFDEINDDKGDAADKEETKRPVVVTNRWRAQGEATPQSRSIPPKVPEPSITDVEACSDNFDEPDSSPKAPPRSSVANRWNYGATSRSNRVSSERVPPPKNASVLDRYKPPSSGTPPRTELRNAPHTEKEASYPAKPEASPNESAEITATLEPKVPRTTATPRVLDRYKPEANKADISSPTWSNRFKSRESEDATVDSQNEIPKETTESVKNAIPKQTTEHVETSSISTGEPTQSSVLNRYKLPAPAEKRTMGSKKQTSAASLSSKAREATPREAMQPEPSGNETKAEAPFVQSMNSLPFDESPTTKLFASIDMSKSSGSVEVELKSGIEKVYDTTDADGFPALSTEEAKEEESFPDDRDGKASATSSAQAQATMGDPSDDLNNSQEEQEEKPLDPKPATTGSAAQRSKALELFVSRRKYQHVEKVHANANPSNGKPPLMEAPVAKPVAGPSKTPLHADAPIENMSNVGDKEMFHSGTSAFTASPKALEERSKASQVSEARSSTIATSMVAKRARRPRSMKEFLNKHRMRSSQAIKSSDSVVSRSSMGSAASSEKPSGGKRTDLSVTTADESVDTRPSLPSLAPTEGSVAPQSVEAKEVKTAVDSEIGLINGEADDDDEPGRIISKTDPELTQKEKPASPSIVASPSPRTRTLQERRRGRHKKVLGRSTATPTSQSKSVSTNDRTSFGEKSTSSETAQISNLRPVQKRAKAFGHQPSGAPSQAKPWTADKKSYPAGISSGQISNQVGARWPQNDSREQGRSVHPFSTTAATSDAGASDTMTFFSAASSGYSTTISNISVDGSVLSPTSSLSNRASRALVRRRRKQLTKEEETRATPDLDSRVTSQTINEQSAAGFDEYHSGDTGQPVQEADTADEPISGHTTVPENDVPRGPGLSGRYNTSSRFMDSVQNLMKNSAPNMSFDSGTTEGSSQIRSVGSTSDSEAWMSGRMRKSSVSSLNRVPSDSTDGVSYQSESVMTNGTGISKKGGPVVTDYFVSESSSNLDALKSAYEAVSLHQIAMDLTDEVSVATSVDLKKIASNLNEGMSAASSSLRSGLNNLNGSRSSSAAKKRPRKLKVPTKSSDTRAVDEEVAIEVEYMEDSDEEDGGEANSPDRSRGAVRDERETPKKKEESVLPAGEPSQEGSSDRRRALV